MAQVSHLPSTTQSRHRLQIAKLHTMESDMADMEAEADLPWKASRLRIVKNSIAALAIDLAKAAEQTGETR